MVYKEDVKSWLKRYKNNARTSNGAKIDRQKLITTCCRKLGYTCSKKNYETIRKILSEVENNGMD